MRNLALLVLMSVLSMGCTARRYMAMGPPAQVEAALEGMSPDDTWRLGEVHVRVEATTGYGIVSSAQYDVSRLREQLAERMRATLISQTNLGARQGPAKYALEIQLEAKERYGFGRQMGLAIGLEVGVLLLGTVVGAAVGAATSTETPPNWTTGYLVGTVAGVPPALLVALATELAGVDGAFSATLVLRRLSDRVPVSERHIDTTWRADYNGFDVQQKLSIASGVGFADFEKVMLTSVKDMLVDAMPAPAPAQVSP